MANDERKAELEQWMVDWFTANLGKSYQHKIEPNLSFFDSGIDSLTGVEFLMALSEHIGRDIQISEGLEHSSIAKLTAYCLEGDEA